MLNNILCNIINHEKDKLIAKGIDTLVDKCAKGINLGNLQDQLNGSIPNQKDERKISLSIKF